MRKITIYSTKGRSKSEVHTDVKTWGELKPILTEQGYQLGGLHATETSTKTDLVSNVAILPEGDFIIIFRPSKTKAGNIDIAAMTYYEIRSVIKGLLNDSTVVLCGKTPSVIFNTGKNYTNKTTPELRHDLAVWYDLSEETPVIRYPTALQYELEDIIVFLEQINARNNTNYVIVDNNEDCDKDCQELVELQKMADEIEDGLRDDSEDD